MLNIFKKSNKKTDETDNVMLEIKRRAEVNAEARKMAEAMTSGMKVTKPAVVGKTPVKGINQYAEAIVRIDSILDKVAAYDNSKIGVLAELMLALETGDDKNLITFLKKPDKKIRVKKKKSSWAKK